MMKIKKMMNNNISLFWVGYLVLDRDFKIINLSE
jgi:hypothetical protein